uniref:Uncharacterized protein n=1 Tax=Anguilla anguilla TaxID=7936 RepID=A0A0E9SNM6_ANGAN
MSFFPLRGLENKCLRD